MLLGVSIFAVRWGESWYERFFFVVLERGRGGGRERQREVDARMQSMDSYILYIYTYICTSYIQVKDESGCLLRFQVVRCPWRLAVLSYRSAWKKKSETDFRWDPWSWQFVLMTTYIDLPYLLFIGFPFFFSWFFFWAAEKHWHSIKEDTLVVRR